MGFRLLFKNKRISIPESWLNSFNPVRERNAVARKNTALAAETSVTKTYYVSRNASHVRFGNGQVTTLYKGVWRAGLVGPNTEAVLHRAFGEWFLKRFSPGKEDVVCVSKKDYETTFGKLYTYLFTGLLKGLKPEQEALLVSCVDRLLFLGNVDLIRSVYRFSSEALCVKTVQHHVRYGFLTEIALPTPYFDTVFDALVETLSPQRLQGMAVPSDWYVSSLSDYHLARLSFFGKTLSTLSTHAQVTSFVRAWSMADPYIGLDLLQRLMCDPRAQLVETEIVTDLNACAILMPDKEAREAGFRAIFDEKNVSEAIPFLRKILPVLAVIFAKNETLSLPFGGVFKGFFPQTLRLLAEWVLPIHTSKVVDVPAVRPQKRVEVFESMYQLALRDTLFPPEALPDRYEWPLNLFALPTMYENLKKLHAVVVHRISQESGDVVAAQTLAEIRLRLSVVSLEALRPEDQAPAKALLGFYHRSGCGDQAVGSDGTFYDDVGITVTQKAFFERVASVDKPAFEILARATLYADRYGVFWTDMMRLQRQPNVAQAIAKTLAIHDYGFCDIAIYQWFLGLSSQRLPKELPCPLQLGRHFSSISGRFPDTVQERVWRSIWISQIVSTRGFDPTHTPDEADTYANQRGLVWQFSRSGAASLNGNRYAQSQGYADALIAALPNCIADPRCAEAVKNMREYMALDPESSVFLDQVFLDKVLGQDIMHTTEVYQGMSVFFPLQPEARARRACLSEVLGDYGAVSEETQRALEILVWRFAIVGVSVFAPPESSDPTNNSSDPWALVAQRVRERRAAGETVDTSVQKWVTVLAQSGIAAMDLDAFYA